MELPRVTPTSMPPSHPTRTALARAFRWIDDLLTPHIASSVARRAILASVVGIFLIVSAIVINQTFGRRDTADADVTFHTADIDNAAPIEPAGDAEAHAAVQPPPVKPPKLPKAPGTSVSVAGAAKFGEGATSIRQPVSASAPSIPAPRKKAASIEQLRTRSDADASVRLTGILLKERADKASPEAAAILAQRIHKHARMDLPAEKRDSLLADIGSIMIGTTGDPVAAPVLDATAAFLPEDLSRVDRREILIVAGLILNGHAASRDRLKLYADKTLDPRTPKEVAKRGILGLSPREFFMIGRAIGQSRPLTFRELLRIAENWPTMPDDQFNLIAGYLDGGRPPVSRQDWEDLIQFLASPMTREGNLMAAGPNVIRRVDVSELLTAFSLQQSREMRSALLGSVAQVRLNSHRAAVLRFATPEERRQIRAADLRKLVDDPWAGTDAVHVVMGGTQDHGRRVNLGQWAMYLDTLFDTDRAAAVDAAYRAVMGRTPLWTEVKRGGDDMGPEGYRVYALRRLAVADSATALKAAADLTQEIADGTESKPRSAWMLTACLGTFAAAAKSPDATLVRKLYTKRERLGDGITNLDGEDYARGQVTSFAVAAGIVPVEGVAWGELRDEAKFGALDVLAGLKRDHDLAPAMKAAGLDVGGGRKRWVAVPCHLVPGMDYSISSRISNPERFEQKGLNLQMFDSDVEAFLSGKLREKVLAEMARHVGG